MSGFSSKDIIKRVFNTQEIIEREKIQDLWSGYGVLKRYELKGADVPSVVVKHICLKEDKAHPRGWNTGLSHQRKLKSYQVETSWYSQWSERCDDHCRVPRCYACDKTDNEILIILEDLNASGFADRRSTLTLDEIKACLKWLAHFHATFLHLTPEGLWPTGTYWHLQTRPDELEVLDDLALKNAAGAIDQKLNTSAYQTFVHGDAKLANFCFSANGKRIAAVDFQYVGGGCGMKDVAYFIGSCVGEDECEELEDKLLAAYFEALTEAVKQKNTEVNADELEREWRELYPVAWTDFHRFIKGWSPGHWKINDYSERIARETIANL